MLFSGQSCLYIPICVEVFSEAIDEISSTINILADLTHVLQTKGFILTKWIMKKQDTLESMSEEHRS